MPLIRVVTDSTCDLPDALVRELGITVLPVNIHLDEATYLDRVDLSTDALLSWIAGGGSPPRTSPPAVAAFEQVYRGLQASRPCDGLVSIHVSSRLSGTYHAALLAREVFVNSSFPVGVVDSQAASMGLGFIVAGAARQAAGGAPWKAVMQQAQRLRGQTHVAFFVDSIEPLYRAGRAGKLTPTIEALLPIKPLLRLDEGQIVLLERTRTRHKAIESLFSFVEDFPHVAALALLYSIYSPEVEALLGRLAGLCPPDHLSAVQYGPANAAYLGTGAIGVAVYEGA